MFPRLHSFTLTLMLACIPGILLQTEGAPSKIDRHSVVERHNVTITGFAKLDSLSVGNGAFAFTVDPTGLQSFPETYETGVCLGTMAEWGWHTVPNTENFRREETIRLYEVPTKTNPVPYSIQGLETERQRQASNYFRQNPHRLHLGLLGFQFVFENGTKAQPSDIESISQNLNLWTGEIHSHYSVCGSPVTVITLCDPNSDTIAFRVESTLIRKGQMHLTLQFPYPSVQHTDSAINLSQETHDQHTSTLVVDQPKTKQWHRQLDTTDYYVDFQSSINCKVSPIQPHAFILQTREGGNDTFEGIVRFSPKPIKGSRSFASIRSQNKQAWKHYWNQGGFVGFEGSTDPRANELERRIILSRYLARIQCAGNYPPQETGLTFNSWYGKFHLEMHWWHAAHWVAWGYPELLEKSLGYYKSVMEVAREKADSQGYEGVRWAKMTDPSGGDSPSDVGEFLIWQQPHIIYFAEQLYRADPSSEKLKTYADLIFATADFMADYPIWDEASNTYRLPPPLIPAQERLPKKETFDPAFELRYWRWALTVAQSWRERLHLPPSETYQQIIDGLPPIPEQNGLYLAAASALDSYTNPHYLSDHPMVLGAIGMLPADETINTETATKTFDYIENHWDWPSTWGWDYPMMAMAATRLAMPEKAVEALLMEVQKNTYLTNGHNYQDERLRIYLPGNGGLLTAIAMMCAGFDGCETTLPGFPDEGWNIKWEGLHPIP